jgi:hypothetical protein
MRVPLFIPLILCDLFCVLMLVTSFNVGPTWKFVLSLVGVVVFTITSILAGGAILRQNEVKQNEGHH